MDEDKLQTFIQKVVGHFEHGDLISLNLSNPKIKSASIKNIQLRPIRLDGKNVAQLKAEQGNKVLTSHLQPAAMAAFIDLALRQDFIAGHCVTAGEQGNILVSRKGHVNVKWKAQEKVHGVSLSHDRQKEYLISAETPFLYSLGVTSSNGLVVAGMQRKFKQINRFTEIFSGLLDDFPTDRHLEVMDMGCGKGYLTFAMYDRLSHMGYNDISVSGVDLKAEVIDLCNEVAATCGYDHLQFKADNINSGQFPQPDILVALHACDTATDEALAYALEHKAQLIMVAPCCQKQVRNDLGQNDLTASLFRFGLVKEQFAAGLTDLIRANVLSYMGYKVQMQEFIGTEHTAKNVLITAKYTGNKSQSALDEIYLWMKTFGIEYHYLLERLKITQPSSLSLT